MDYPHTQTHIGNKLKPVRRKREMVQKKVGFEGGGMGRRLDCFQSTQQQNSIMQVLLVYLLLIKLQEP